jgi:hypothetical protein
MRASSATSPRICAAVLSAALASLPLAAADKDPTPVPPPVPAQILTARKVFIANAGFDGNAFAILQRAGDAEQPYNQFYAAIKSSGRFEIVGAPIDADLVIEIRFSAHLSGTGKVDTYQPLVTLTILDSKTHFLLWTITEPVESAILAKTWQKNFDNGIANLVRDLTALAAQPDAGGAKQ